MKRCLLILTLLFSSSFLLQAQEDEEARLGKLQEKMQQYIQKRLNLTKGEAEKFSPIFMRYISELRKAHQENRTDRPMQQLKMAEVRVRYRNEFRQVIDEQRANKVFQYEKEFQEIVKREIIERRMQNRQGPGRRIQILVD
ncbi:MAG: hypothetical protein IAE96_07940 [Chitinophagaceae bacterium]|nr:hypothetical protein [Chitinophagaceae bacterium]